MDGRRPRPILARLSRGLWNFQFRQVVADQMSEFSPYLNMTPIRYQLPTCARALNYTGTALHRWGFLASTPTLSTTLPRVA